MNRPAKSQVLRTIFSLVLLSVLNEQATADTRDSFFDRKVAPILSAHCLSCHRGEQPKAGLDLSHRESTMRGGESGAVVTPGNTDESYLWELVDTGEMPPEHSLPAEQKEIIRQWIADGANWGTDPIDPFAFSSSTRAGYDWWSLQPLATALIPQTENDRWSVNEIDRFVFDRLKRNQLQPSPRAEPRTLVRRLYVDLIGLPAPVEIVTKFAAEPSPQAWQKLIDDLLSSEHYGERWARHWMDVARFGESDGYEYNRPRENFWYYRDWLIQALNADMPYHQFVRMQLSGDLIAPDKIEGLAAVGFLVAGTHNTVLGASPTMKLAARHDELEELAGTVAQTFLGMTVNCARCHDHKLDPITAQEYFSFIAALDGVQHGEQKLPKPRETVNRRSRTLRALDEVERRLVEQILARGGTASTTANLILADLPLAANLKDRTYRVSMRLAPSVWAAVSQATSQRDGVSVSVLSNHGATLGTHSARPGAWNRGKNSAVDQELEFEYVGFEYVGTGDGGIRIHFRPFPLNSGRFGGAVDDVSVVDVAAEKTVFSENFDTLRRPYEPGSQADTNRPVYFGATSNRWKHSGTNTIHLVEHADGNFALQLFGGNGGSKAIEIETPAEQHLRAKLESLKKQLQNTLRPTVYTVIARNPGVMNFFRRGDVTRPGAAVRPSGLAAIRNLSASFDVDQNSTDSERRLRLAEWITHRDNPLFHRVAVNRIWQYHFGKGLVQTPNDFGFNGGRPSHPGLLDWLSHWFRDHDYSIKELHRLIVSSATYQQSSRLRADKARHDASNRLLWRQNARRVEAEVLRDSILQIAGQLNQTPFGPGYRDVEITEVPPAFYYSPIDPVGTAFHRRTIYRWHVRGQRSALLDTFDCPDPSTKTPTRTITTTPSQALSQWNDSFVIRMSKRLAERIQAASGDDIDAQVTFAWRAVLARTPETWEHQQAVRLVRDHELALLCRVLFNSNEFVLID